MKKVIHIINVSAQPIPNVLPVLDDVRKYSAGSVSVLLCVSAKMEKQAGWIKDFLSDKGVEVDRWSTRVPENDWSELRGYFDEVARSVVDNARAEEIIVNLTGGTKLMSFAIYSAFFARRDKAKVDFIYVDTPSKSSPKCLSVISGDSHKFSKDLLRVEDFLELYGKKVTNREENLRPKIDPKKHAFLEDMMNLQKKYPELNSSLIDWRQRGTEPSSEICSVFRKHRRVVYDDSGRLRPNAEQQFLTGGWFEHYVYDILKERKEERKDIQDVATNMKIEAKDGAKYEAGEGVKNELDVAFVMYNRLFVVECKTGSRKDTKDIAYKYKDVVNELGTACTGWLISTKPLKQADATRLKDAEKIELCEGSDDASDIPSWINNQLNKHSAP